MDKLYVFINQNFEGTLTKDKTSGFIFQYDKNAQNSPISLSLPYQEEPYSHKECSGYFNGLLPESDDVRAKIAEKYGIRNPNNDFAILRAIGYDCPGAVAFLESKENNLKEYYEIDVEYPNENELETFIKELPQKPLLTGAKNLRLSLAGAQDKTGVLLIDGKIALPGNNTPTTHILKPAIKNFKETVENEYICMKAAEKLGIKVPSIQIGQAGNAKYFLIERYDRAIKDNKIKRLHQEDFCQIKNIISAYKYEIDGGVSFKNCFEILKQTSNPALALRDFINRMIFNYLVINNDAHGKNYSILYLDNKIEFSPAYDLLCTKVYKQLDYKMAMSIGGYYDSEGIKPVHFEKLSKETGISFPLLRNTIKSQCEQLPDIFSDIIKTFDNKIGIRILDTVSKNCKKNFKNFSS